MELEQLYECDADTLERMTDAELLEHFKKYLPTTRPELAKIERDNTPKRVPAYNQQKQLPMLQLDEKKRKTLNALAATGDLDLEFLKRRMKNR